MQVNHEMSAKKKIGIVIPTLGINETLLRTCLSSIRFQEDQVEVIVVVVSENQLIKNLSKEFNFKYIVRPKQGIFSAINDGVSTISKDIDYFCFLGDDDYLFPNALKALIDEASKNPVDVIYGKTVYVGDSGEHLQINPAFRFAPKILHALPNLIPNPGTLIKVATWERMGGYRGDLLFAGDLDLWLKISKVGEFSALKVPIAAFRFSKKTMTGGRRKEALKEASKVRVLNTPVKLRWLQKIWNPALTIVGEILFSLNLRIQRLKHGK
jgi:glycosyltransferase involved in cell wall biosynthesis